MREGHVGRVKLHTNKAKQARALLKLIRVDGKPLPTEPVWEASNQRQKFAQDDKVAVLYHGLFWLPRITPYVTATFKHSRATMRGAYRALKRRLKNVQR